MDDEGDGQAQEGLQGHGNHREPHGVPERLAEVGILKEVEVVLQAHELRRLHESDVGLEEGPVEDLGQGVPGHQDHPQKGGQDQEPDQADLSLGEHGLFKDTPGGRAPPGKGTG